MRLTLKQNGQPWGQPITSRLGEVVPPAAFPMYLGYGIRGQVRHKVQLSGDETQWVLQQLQGLGEKKKIAQRIWAWPLDIPDLTVATAALTDIAVAVHHVYPTHVGCSARGCLEQRTRAAVRVQPLRGEPSRSPTVLFAYRTKPQI